MGCQSRVQMARRPRIGHELATGDRDADFVCRFQLEVEERVHWYRTAGPTCRRDGEGKCVPSVISSLLPSSSTRSGPTNRFFLHSCICAFVPS